MTFLGHEISHPSYIPMTAWLRHGPFAMWLVKAARPEKIVELGSHYGFSYFAFCQAVKEAGLPTRCIAVDTWQGDEHSGLYGEEVFKTVQAENRQYADFSTLLRTTFAEALDDVDDGSVDILHVDGRHFYDDIKEDFESWIPKLAERAVILFHDTEVRERGFGVWRYWAELAEAHPVFNFLYQHGLGVLFWGDDLTPELAAFRQASQSDVGRDALNALFGAAGNALAADHTQAVLADKAVEGLTVLSDTMRVLESGKINPESQIGPLDNGGTALASSLLTATSRLDQLGKTVSQCQEQTLDLRVENQTLRSELVQIRSNPLRVWRDYVTHRILDKLVSSSLPISERAQARFAKSAKKRDPKREFAAYGQPSLVTADLPLTKPRKAKVIAGRRKRDDARDNVLVVTHEASRTGAPILAHNISRLLSERYNVTVLSVRSGGDLMDALLDVSVDVVVAGGHPQLGDRNWRQIKHFLSGKSLEFAVVNSVESRSLLPLLDEMGVTSISLIHEFAAYTRPRTAFAEVMNYADHVVFSSPLTRDNAAEAVGLELTPKVHVFPQGKCTVPGRAESQVVDAVERQRLKALLRPVGHENDFLVIGTGHVQIRKGVDLFIEVARQALAAAKSRTLRFVWIGAGYDPEQDAAYSVYLQDQLKRSGLTDDLRILPPTSEIEYAYELADALLLPSRLDPLPNVAIDAMLTGVPVLCFDTATGISDVLRQGALDAACVAEYLNATDMVEKLQALASSPGLYADVSERTQAHARAIFDMDAYVGQIEGLALAAKARKRNRVSDIDIIASETRFRSEYVLRPGTRADSAREAAEQYLADISRVALPRRPEPGFNPHVYGGHMLADSDRPLDTDPYCDFLGKGRPEGPWSLPVIRETADAAPSEAARALRSALHIHAYYVDALDGLRARVMMNWARPALYVSVADEEAKAEAGRILSGYEADCDIRIMPNCGRDIGPFLTGFGAKLVEKYDIVGHVHTKKSVALSDRDLVRNWTRFLYENILGGETGGPMLDRVLNAFSEDEGLGIVFPSDPNLMAWSRNREQASRLTCRLGLGDLPDAFDFPVGTMFWMRTDALRPFLDLKLDWTDYPREPVADDGTILHALERLFGVVPLLRGYRAAVTSVTGLTR